MQHKKSLIARREAIQKIGIFAAGALVTPTVLAPSCDKPNLDPKFAIAFVVADQLFLTLKELGVKQKLLDIGGKIVTVLHDAQDFYRKSDFTSALAVVNQIIAPDGLFNQILDDLEIQSNNTVKTILLTLRGALSIIAVLLAGQMVNVSFAANATHMANMQKLADGKQIDAALKVLRF